MNAQTAPTLRTARLVLRGFAPDDLDALAAIYADAEVMRYLSGGVRTRAQTSERLASYTREWAEMGYGVWAVTLPGPGQDGAADGTAGGALLGMCGFVAREELGYIYGRAAWGQGYATEAARACLRYGFERVDLGFDEIGAGALADNMASRHVIEKLGMRRVANAFFDRNGGVYYRIGRAAFLERLS